MDERPPFIMLTGFPGSGKTSFLKHFIELQTHVHDGLCSRCIRFLGRLDRGRFLEAAESIPPAIFRAKGIIDASDPPQTMLCQFVAGRCELSVFSRAPTGDRFLTLIGKREDTGIFDRIEKLVRAAES